MKLLWSLFLPIIISAQLKKTNIVTDYFSVFPALFASQIYENDLKSCVTLPYTGMVLVTSWKKNPSMSHPPPHIPMRNQRKWITPQKKQELKQCDIKICCKPQAVFTSLNKPGSQFNYDLMVFCVNTKKHGGNIVRLLNQR